MRPCQRTGCTAVVTHPVRTRRGTLDVCDKCETLLRDAGEIADPEPVIPIVVDSAEHRAKIRAGIDSARERGTHVGRPPTPVPEAAIEAVRNGAPLKPTARAHGVDSNTLRRRVDRDVAGPSVATPDPWAEGHRLLGEAIRLRDKANAAITAAQAQLAEADDMAARARDLLSRKAS